MTETSKPNTTTTKYDECCSLLSSKIHHLESELAAMAKKVRASASKADLDTVCKETIDYVRETRADLLMRVKTLESTVEDLLHNARKKKEEDAKLFKNFAQNLDDSIHRVQHSINMMEKDLDARAQAKVRATRVWPHYLMSSCAYLAFVVISSKANDLSFIDMLTNLSWALLLITGMASVYAASKKFFSALF